MAFSRLGQSLTATEIMDLVVADLRRIEHKIDLETMAAAGAVTTISHYLNGNGGKRLRPILLLLSNKLIGETTDSAIHLGRDWLQDPCHRGG